MGVDVMEEHERTRKNTRFYTLLQLALAHLLEALRQVYHVLAVLELVDERLLLLEQVDKVKLILSRLENLDALQVKDDRLLIIITVTDDIEDVALNLLLLLLGQLEVLDLFPRVLELLLLDVEEQAAATTTALQNLRGTIIVERAALDALMGNP